MLPVNLLAPADALTPVRAIATMAVPAIPAIFQFMKFSITQG
jgi:hypothetical protein